MEVKILAAMTSLSSKRAGSETEPVEIIRNLSITLFPEFNKAKLREVLFRVEEDAQSELKKEGKTVAFYITISSLSAPNRKRRGKGQNFQKTTGKS